MLSGSFRVVLLTSDRASDAAALTDAILRQVSSSGGTLASFDVTQDPSVIAASPKPGDPSTALVLLSCSPSAASDPKVIQAISDAFHQFVAVLPVYDSARGSFNQQFPPALNRLNGVDWPVGSSPEKIAGTILRLVGLAEKDRRVFLSYRRKDGTEMAEQLRIAMLNAGWDVFLDRFGVAPGADFQKSLERELADKAFVLLLETPDVAASRWIEHEVAFALQRRLALMALTTPDTLAATMHRSIPSAFRRQLLWSEVNHSSVCLEIGLPALNAVLQEIDERHAYSYNFRRVGLMEETSEELTNLGFRVEPIGQWSLLAEHRTTGNLEIVLTTVRAPDPQDIRAVDTLRRRCRNSRFRSRGWIVHPIEDIDEDRASLVAWLCGRRLIEPTPLMLLAKQVQT